MLDTYGMDDINTQAIRELTTEVFKLKNNSHQLKEQTESDISEITDRLEDIEKIKVTYGQVTRVTPIQIQPSMEIFKLVSAPIPTTLPGGYTLKAFTITCIYNSSDSSVGIVVVECVAGTNPSISVINPSQDALTIAKMNYIAVYEKTA